MTNEPITLIERIVCEAEDALGSAIDVRLAADPAAADFELTAADGAAWSENAGARLAAAVQKLQAVHTAAQSGSGKASVRLSDQALKLGVDEAVAQGGDWGRSVGGTGQRVLVEFVSAHPNAPLTVSHGRGGALGDAIAALLQATGADVQREFYVNDSDDSRPLRDFARAVLARCHARCGVPDASPSDSYPGGWVDEIAAAVLAAEGPAVAVLPVAEALPILQKLSLQLTVEAQRGILDRFGIKFDNWFFESRLASDGSVGATLAELERSGHAERRGAALWL